MDTTKYILAVDMGTSGPKVALVSTGGEIVGHEFEPTPVHVLGGGGAEQDPDDWWRAITTASRRLMGRGLVAVDDVVAVSVTAQWAGTVAVDRDGGHLMNAVIWMDTRGGKYVDEVVKGLVEIEGYGVTKLVRWIRLSGGLPGHHGKDPTAHILFIKRERAEVYEAAHKFLEPKDWVNLRLTGAFAAGVDSIMLHWVTDTRDIRNVRYHGGLVRMTGIDPAKLPDLKLPTDVLGPVKKEVAEEMGLGSDVKVVLGTPDVHSASIGSGAVRDFAGHIYLGTSSWITCHVPFKKTDLLHQIASVPSGIPGRYLLANDQENAGSCLTYLRDNLIFPDDGLGTGRAPDGVYGAFDAMVERTSAGSGGVLFLPYLCGERAPIDDKTTRAAFVNQSLGTTRSHLVRAVYEGIAYNSRWLMGYIEKFIGGRFEALNMVGGGARSDAWCQIYADVLDRKICRVRDPIHAGARGVAWLASAALGYIEFDQIPDLVRIERTFEPDQGTRKLHDERFEEFLALYRATKKIYKRLNRG